MHRSLARAISFLGHPMLVLTYVLLLMLAVNPYAFGARRLGDANAVVLLFSVFTTSFLIPGAGIALMKPLGLIKSLEMHDKQERIGPYIITGVFYLWLFKNLFSLGQGSTLFSGFVLGATIGLFLVFFINIFTKISAHAAGMGGLVVMVVLLSDRWQHSTAGIPAFGGTVLVSMELILYLVLLLAGLVGVARLALNAHTPADLYRGYLAGAAAVVLAQALV